MQWLPASSSPLGWHIKGGGRSSSQAVKSGLSVDLVNTVFESVPLRGHFTHSFPSVGGVGGQREGESSDDRHQRRKKEWRFGGCVCVCAQRGGAGLWGFLRVRSPVTTRMASVDGKIKITQLSCFFSHSHPLPPLHTSHDSWQWKWSMAVFWFSFESCFS